MWTTERAVDFAHLLEPLADKHGLHIGLTGGCLYKEGPRKDADFIVYGHYGAEGEFADRRAAFETSLLEATAMRVTGIANFSHVTKLRINDILDVDLIYVELREPGKSDYADVKPFDVVRSDTDPYSIF